MSGLDGIYRFDFVRNGARTPMGLLVAKGGSVTGFDLRKIAYSGTYRQELPDGPVQVSLAVKVPAATRLVAGVTSHADETRLQLEFELDGDALAGAPARISADLASAHASNVELSEVTLSLERLGTA